MLPKKVLVNEFKSKKDLDIYIDNFLIEVRKGFYKDMTDYSLLDFIEDYIAEHDSVFITINDKKFLL